MGEKRVSSKSSQSWISPAIVLADVGPKLVPFFKTGVIYFVIADREDASWFTCLLKCLPILCLCGFVIVHGMSLRDKHTYSRHVLTGLLFSCLGDALLVWPSYFIWGMLSFSVAHMFYIIAFRFEPLEPWSGAICAAFAAIGYYILAPGLSGILVEAVPIYALLLMATVWRGMARVQFSKCLWTWTKLCSCFGVIMFAVSDTLLGLSTFGVNTGLNSRLSQTLVMLTYYGAQLGIALSVVDSNSLVDLNASKEPEIMDNSAPNGLATHKSSRLKPQAREASKTTQEKATLKGRTAKAM